jgi:hypothetical protein
VPRGTVQEVWRDWFEQWGLSEEVRLDNGLPWGGRRDHLPTAFALWLAGLGVSAWYNPPRSPQDNGVIECGNGNGQRWSEVGKCRSAKELQKKVDFADRIQRERLCSIDGQTRTEAFPGLAQPWRAYDRGWEEKHWDLAKAEAVLEGYAAPRKVSSQGHVSVYARDVYVGTRHAGRQARVQYDSGSKMWVISAEDGGQVFRCVPAVEVTREKIVTLTMGEKG